MEFAGTIFASEKIFTGLQDLHQSIKAITQVRQLRELLTVQKVFLKKVVSEPVTQDEIETFENTRSQIDQFFKNNLELVSTTPDAYKLIADAQKIVLPLHEQVEQAIQLHQKTKINALVVEQYLLETQDLLGKVQLVLAREADRIFTDLYSVRFIPLFVGFGLTIVFLLFAIWMGVTLKNKITQPIRKLVEATDALANGDLTVRTEIVEANEVGALDHAFNVMASKLEESITERHNVELDLIEAKDAAEAASLAKSAFLANMSHEIRTPLGAVLGFSELVADPYVPQSEKSKFVVAIKRNGELLSNIINDILDLSKIEAGKMKVEFRSVSLEEVLNDTKTLLDLQAKEKGIDLTVTQDPSLPRMIMTDALRLRQILINIIGNAIKFTSKGTVDLKIEMKSFESGKKALAFIVKDTGNGIQENQIAKLFAPFSQADGTSKRKFGGTGLGLILSKRFANLLGGDVILKETKVGQGSTFFITIDPGVNVSDLVAPEKVKAIEHNKQNLLLAGSRVLLAEDSPDNQILITHFLSIAGSDIDVVSNGREATEMALKNDYDVILMDIQMPVMDGYEATAFLRGQGYQGVIIALTAHALNEERVRALQSGFDDHLSKPINRDLLIDRIHYFRQTSI